MSMRRAFTLASLLICAGTALAPSAAAQTCDPRQGVTFLLAPATTLSSVALKPLVPNGTRPTLLGTGTLVLADGSVIPLAVKARARSRRASTVTYRFTGRTAVARVHGRIVTQGCPATPSTVGIAVRKGNASVRVKDPTLISLAATLAADTILLDTTDIGGLTIDPADPMQLLVPSGDPLLTSVHPGTVLLAGITPATPRGLLRIVASIEPGVVTTVLVTTFGTLDDAFDTLDVEVGDGPAAAPVAGGLATPRVKFEGAISASFTQDVHQDFENLIGVDPLAFDANLSLSAGLSLGIHTGKKYLVIPTLKSAHAELSGTLSIGASMSCDAGFSLAKSGKLTLVPAADLGPPVEVAPGVVVQPALEIDAGVEDSFGGAFDVDGQASVEVLVGVQCHGTSCSPELQATPTVSGAVTVDQAASVGVFVEPALDFKIDEVVSLSVGPQLAVDLTADLSADPWWHLDGVGSADVAVDVDLGIVDFTPFDLSLELFALRLAEAPGPFEGTTTTTSTTTTTTETSTTTSTLPGGPCGDGVVEAGEECDDGANNGAMFSCCTTTCTLLPVGTVCGPNCDCELVQQQGSVGCVCTIF